MNPTKAPPLGGNAPALPETPDRTCWVRELESVLRDLDGARNVAVALVDIDRFRVVSQGLGASRSQEELCAFASRLGDQAGDSAVFWIGADRFGVLGIDVSDPDEWGTNLLSRTGDVAVPGSRSLPLRASAGVVPLRPGLTTDDVAVRAEIALQHAKARGGACHEVFDEEEHQTAMLQQSLRIELLHALQQGHLCMHYQPILRLVDGAVAGFEALLRWQHPERGLLAPALFIPVLERDGMIDLVGEWIFRRAGTEFAALVEAGAPWHPLMTINVSRQQLRSPHFAASTLDVLRSCGVSLEHVGLEITETSAIDDLQAARAQLQRCREAGASVLIDDFGVGSSSMASLHDFPVDVLKIDRQFVQGAVASPRRRALTRAITEVGHALGLSLVAEGIETPEELAAMHQLGCDYGQGYLLGRPAPFEDCLELLQRHRVQRAPSPTREESP